MTPLLVTPEFEKLSAALVAAKEYKDTIARKVLRQCKARFNIRYAGIPSDGENAIPGSYRPEDKVSLLEAEKLLDKIHTNIPFIGLAEATKLETYIEKGCVSESQLKLHIFPFPFFCSTWLDPQNAASD